MKVKLNESQYKVLLKEDRVTYLRNANVVSEKDFQEYLNKKDKPQRRGPDGETSIGKKDLEPIIGLDNEPIAFFQGPKKKLKLTPETYDAFVEADPSGNKEYLQWIIDIFKKEVSHDLEESKRFVGEDLPQATEALEVFNRVKKTKLFKQAAPQREGAPDNPKDIRKYNSVGQLSSVVAAFADMGDDELGDSPEGGNPSGMSNKGYKLFKDLVSYVKLGQAKMHKLSDRMVIYQPQSLRSSCEALGSLATWCTRATPTGGIEKETGSEYFHSYRGATGQNARLRPGGGLSDYYVIMPIELFQMEQPRESQMYPLQFHLESSQFKDRNNVEIGKNGIEKVISEYPELGDYMRKEIGKWASESVKHGDGIMSNKYIDFLNDFGGSAENYISKEDYDKGVESIKASAKEYSGAFNSNKYLKWLIANTEDVNIVDYIAEDATTVDFSGFNLKRIPDLSSFDKIVKVVATNAGLTEFPNGDELPPNMDNIILSKNSIKELTFENFDKLSQLKVMLAMDNPYTKIDVDELVNFIKNSESIFTIGLSPNEVKNLSNYDEYFGKLSELRKELGSYDFPVIEPFGFDFDD